MTDASIGTDGRASSAEARSLATGAARIRSRSRRSVLVRLITGRFRRRVKADRHAMATGAGMAGLLALVMTLLLLPPPFGLVHIMAAFATFQLIAALHFALSLPPSRGTDDAERERLADLVWRLNEREARLRAMLDGQDSLIVCRDQQGRVTFVNRAFCRLIGVDGKALIGKPLALPLVEDTTQGRAPDPTASVSLQQIATVLGPRWIDWREQRIASTAAHDELLVGRDVTAERAAATAATAARDEAQAADQSKSRFLAAMSHEIRTPMSGILGMAGLLLGTEATGEQRTYASAIDRSARTLLALIDEILDFSKIEAGKLQLEAAPFALDECVGGVVELLSPRAHEKNIEIAWMIEPGTPLAVVGDEARVRQILLNLVGNAVKFTDRGGVLVRVAPPPAAAPAAAAGRDGTRLVIHVEDTGIGISAGDLPRLFTDFGQADRVLTGRKGGTGLGLAISRRLARAMGGNITVASRPGAGSTFSAELTLALQRLAVQEPVAAPGQSAAGRRVLLAFDRAIERRAAAGVLAAHAVDAVEADVADVVARTSEAAAAGCPYDTVVIDAAIGAQRAISLLAEARAANAGRALEGVVLIDAATRPLLAELRASGFSGWAVRPLRPHAFARVIMRGISDEEPEAKIQAASVPLVLPGGRAIRVLLAEDDDVNALLGSCVLRKAGCLATVVRTGREAVEAVRAGLAAREPDFDIVLMDIVMPELGGIEAARAIHKLYAGRTDGPRIAPPIVALTANAFAEDRQRYLAAGLDDYLSKPFDSGDLQALLRRWSARLKVAA